MSDYQSERTVSGGSYTPRSASADSGTTRERGASHTVRAQPAASHVQRRTSVSADNSNVARITRFSWAALMMSTLQMAAKLSLKSGRVVTLLRLSVAAILLDLMCVSRRGAITHTRYKVTIMTTISRSRCSGFAFVVTGLSTDGLPVATTSLRWLRRSE